jgi:PPOX class probable F420-dependent enzyme
MARAPALSDRVRAFLTERNRFAVIATVDPDGGPRQAFTWVTFDEDGAVWVNSRRGRRWPANLERDRRASIAILDLEDTRRWVGLTCVLEEIVDDVERARDDIVALAHRYHPEGPDPADLAAYRTQPRVMFRLRITAVHDHLED